MSEGLIQHVRRSAPASWGGEREVHDIVARVASNDPPILITGESGPGKELVAREITLVSFNGSSGRAPLHSACGRSLSGNESRAARVLGIRKTQYRRLVSHGVSVSEAW